MRMPLRTIQIHLRRSAYLGLVRRGWQETTSAVPSMSAQFLSFGYILQAISRCGQSLDYDAAYYGGIELGIGRLHLTATFSLGGSIRVWRAFHAICFAMLVLSYVQSTVVLNVGELKLNRPSELSRQFLHRQVI